MTAVPSPGRSSDNVGFSGCLQTATFTQCPRSVRGTLRCVHTRIETVRDIVACRTTTLSGNISDEAMRAQLAKGQYSVYTRRFFVKSGLALSAIALGPTTELQAHRTPLALRSPEKLSLHLAVVDASFAAGRAFGAAMRERFVPVADYLGDVTGVWYERLDPVWRCVPIAVGGLTTEGALFCLERLAWDHGMRRIYRGTHSHLPDGGTQHLLESNGGATRVHDSPSSPELWTAQVANLMLEMSSSVSALPSQTQEHHRITYHTGRAEVVGVDGPHLASWLIVPHARRA